MKAIVHIGIIKTGTTSIQRFLYTNRHHLAERGYHYSHDPKDKTSRKIASYCISNEQDDEFFSSQGAAVSREQIRQEILRCFQAEIAALPRNIHTVILSSEHFHFRIRTDSEIKTLHSLLSAQFESIRIICYLREQAATCDAYYSTALRGGEVRSHRDFFNHCRPGNILYNYRDLLDLWASYFGLSALDIAIFSQTEFLRGDLLCDFTARIDPNLLGELDYNIGLKNESLSPMGDKMLLHINRALPNGKSTSEQIRLRRLLHQIIYRRFRGRSGKTTSNDLFSKTEELFNKSNKRACNKYFPGRRVLFEKKERPVIQKSESVINVYLTCLSVISVVAIVGPIYLSKEQRSALYSIIQFVGSVNSDQSAEWS